MLNFSDLLLNGSVSFLLTQTVVELSTRLQVPKVRFRYLHSVDDWRKEWKGSTVFCPSYIFRLNNTIIDLII